MPADSCSGRMRAGGRRPGGRRPGGRYMSIRMSNREETEKTSDQSRNKQEERLDYLLNKFKEDSVQYRDLETGEDYDEKRKYLRSLMNIRMPGPMDEDVVRVQDEFLTEEAKEKGIVELKDIPAAAEQYGSNHPYADKISIWQGDITRLHVGAMSMRQIPRCWGALCPATDVLTMPSTAPRGSNCERRAVII